MKIILNDNFYITSDPLNIILVECGETKKGNDKTVTRYFKTPAEAIARFLELSRKDKTADFDGHIEEYFDAINKANDEILKSIVMKYEKAVNNG